MGEEFAITGVQLATDNGPPARAALYRELKQLPAVQAVNARADMIEQPGDHRRNAADLHRVRGDCSPA